MRVAVIVLSYQLQVYDDARVLTYSKRYQIRYLIRRTRYEHYTAVAGSNEYLEIIRT